MMKMREDAAKRTGMGRNPASSGSRALLLKRFGQMFALAALAVSGSPAWADEEPDHVFRPPDTLVLDRTGLDRLIANKGLTLQWIDWDRRGGVTAWMDGGLLRLHGSQSAANGEGMLHLDGYVSEIGPGYFIFDGAISIVNTPDEGRTCEKSKIWHFAVTQNRKYYRLREFEWCDDLTDYIDIYF